MIKVVGGKWSYTDPKSSKIISELSIRLGANSVLNGGHLQDLPASVNADLIVWMPDIDNYEVKSYPGKPKGSFMVISKVIRGTPTDDSIGEAISRIFKLNANMVVTISKNEKTDWFMFSGYDPLGNKLFDTYNIDVLANEIEYAYAKHNSQVRVSTRSIDTENMKRFIKLIHTVQDKCEKSRGGRYFGNASTRCSNMFPSLRMENLQILVSKRNIDKDAISIDDFVMVEPSSIMVEIDQVNPLICMSSSKPSVDSAVQLYLYNELTQINYMIHGHAEISENPFALNTTQMFACGDLREAIHIYNDVLPETGRDYYAVNIKNHGFLLMSKTIGGMEYLIKNTVFTTRAIELPKLEETCAAQEKR